MTVEDSKNSILKGDDRFGQKAFDYEVSHVRVEVFVFEPRV
jgi:hypothetical protein